MRMVSLVVPVYNAGAFLTPLVRSVLKQDYADFQLILSDDGSTDSSLEQMECFSREDSRITLVTGSGIEIDLYIIWFILYSSA